jgi:hypothetical protein
VSLAAVHFSGPFHLGILDVGADTPICGFWRKSRLRMTRNEAEVSCEDCRRLLAEADPVPPHDNAGPHAALKRALAKMTPEEIVAISVRAGVHNPDGTLRAGFVATSACDCPWPCSCVELARLRAALEWFADAGHYQGTYQHGAGFVDALGLSRARAALLGLSPEDGEAVAAAWAERERGGGT